MSPGDRYSVRLTTCARHQFNLLPAELRELALRELLRVAGLAAEVTPPSREALQAAHVDPPVLQVNAWPLVVVYECDPVRRALTVLHLLSGSAVKEHAGREVPAAARHVASPSAPS